MRITVAQVNSYPGDFIKNYDIIKGTLRRAMEDNSQLVVFPEGMIHGYMSMDLILNPEFIERGNEELKTLIDYSKNESKMKGITIIVGSFIKDRNRLYNSAVIIKNGVTSVVHKRLLPEYDIFFERRYFHPGIDSNNIIMVGDTPVGVCVCEDMWDASYDSSPVKDLVNHGAKMIVNISHSPYYIGKDKERDEIIRNHAKWNGVDFLYVNAVGTHDGYDGEIVFEGGSRFYDKTGTLKWKAPYLESHVETIDTKKTEHIDPTQQAFEDTRELYRLRKALGIAVRDYCKRSGFIRVVLGMSGGIDSALAAAICCDALGPNNVMGITMPSEYSSEGSVNDSRDMAKLLGFDLMEIPIKDVHDLVKTNYINAKHIAPFNGKVLNSEINGLTDENIQPRLRMLYLMMFSNNTDSLLITTGNKTELALGYCTLYGDMAGGLAVLADLDKLVVRSLFDYYIEDYRRYTDDNNENKAAGIQAMMNILTKPPSAELAPDQEDEKAFDMAFQQLVPLVNQIVDGQDSLETIIASNPDIHKSKIKTIWHRIKVQEFKRRQVSPGIKVTPKAFGIGRRIPMSHGW